MMIKPVKHLRFLRHATVAILLAMYLNVGGKALGQGLTDNPKRTSSKDSVELRLAGQGKAMQPVVIAPDASESTRKAARDLSAMLGRISGASFEVQTGDGTHGLAVGVYTDFPALKHGAQFTPDDPFRRDDYLLRTHAAGAYVLGAGEQAVHLAVWDFLHRFGYRLFFLTDTWEVVPKRPDMRLALDTLERPDFVTRLAPRGSPWSDREQWQRWRLRNRLASSFSLNTGHAYSGIIRANREAFKANPDYVALVDGERRAVDGHENIKFCIGNPGLRRLVVDHAVRKVRATPGLDSMSMDPSDGGNWCTCTDCAAMGTVTDRALTLANLVAKAINRVGLGSKIVGMYAYNDHSPPPTIEVHSNVVISVATSFIRGGYTLEELIDGWRAHGATLGIRDYHDVFTWSHDLPRKARGGNIDYLREQIPDFHAKGARFMDSENTDSWGANGLGYWLSARMVWDIDAAKHVDAIIEDFLLNAFGEAREPMRDFYRLLNRDQSVRSNDDVVARMYRHLAEARRLTRDSAVVKRLDDLVLYTRYVELYHAYRMADGDQRQKGFEHVWRHAYRMKDRMLLSTVAICNRDRFRDKSVSVPDEAAWNVPEDKNPWKSSRPYEVREIAAILAAGIEANQPTELDFKPVAYSEDLVPARELGLTNAKPGKRPDRFRRLQKVYTWLPEGRETIELKVTGGLIAHYRDRGHVKFQLHAAAEATRESVASDESVPPDGKERTIILTTPHGDLHTLEWSDGGDMTRVAMPGDLPLTFRSTLDNPQSFVGRWSLYFYVPKGTRSVAGFTTGTAGKLRDGNGREVFSFDSMKQAGYFNIAVPNGQDGMLWRFENCAGSRMLMTVPPYLAARAGDLLLPHEVLEADRRR
jgi:hypothetical protein